MGKVSIVGVGPGTKEYISGKGLSVIKKAEMLIGSEPHLEIFASKRSKTRVLRGNYTEIIDLLARKNNKKSIVVMVSGDPGIFSFSKMLIKKIGAVNCEVIPGISAVQLLCARAGEAWNDIQIISLHGKTKRGLSQAVRKNKKVFIFNDPKNDPSAVARYLDRSDAGKYKVIVGENLSLKDETVTISTIKKLSKIKKEWKKLCVMLIKK